MYETASGQTVRLGTVLGKGGEGTVYSLESNALKVIKIYHQPPSQDLVDKLIYMTSICSSDLQSMSCWPEAVVLDRKAHRTMGYVMPSAAGYREIHKLCGPKSRAQEFPSATWQFLLQVALNVCKTFSYLHSIGHVVGDINHSSVMVKDDATVKLIDCDSIQVKSGPRTFRCTVGEPLHTPPELQGLSLRNLDRTVNHDNFGLAVLIFELLFMGRHPYIGQYLGTGHLTPEQKIGMNLFAYSESHKSSIVEPPPYSLRLNQIDIELRMLFERAFSIQQKGISRPKPEEWLAAIRTQLRNLKKCSLYESHYYDQKLTVCPWCQLDQSLNIYLFSSVLNSPRSNERFNLQETWAAIQAIVKPDIKPVLTSAKSVRQWPAPSSEILEFCTSRSKGSTIASYVIVAAFVCFAWFSMIPAAAIMIAMFGLLVVLVYWFKSLQILQNLKQSSRDQEAKVIQMQRDSYSDNRFEDCLAALKTARESYLALGAKRVSQVSALTQSANAIRERKFLEGCLLRSADIGGIGSSRKAMLLAYGIETAADVTVSRVLAIPGFGPSLASELMQWRLHCLTRFNVNLKPTLDPSELMRIDRTLDAERSVLQLQLTAGLKDLERIASEITVDLDNLSSKMMQSAALEAQISVDLVKLRNNWIV